MQKEDISEGMIFADKRGQLWEVAVASDPTVAGIILRPKGYKGLPGYQSIETTRELILSDYEFRGTE